MNRREKIDILNLEVKEISDLLSGINEYDKIPKVLLEMAHAKAIRVLQGITALKDEEAKPIVEPKATVSPVQSKPAVEPAQPQVTFISKKQAQAVEPAKTQPIEEKTVIITETIIKEEPVKETFVEEADAKEAEVYVSPEDVIKAETLLSRQEEKPLPQSAPIFEKVFQEFPATGTTSVKDASDIRRLMTLNDRFLFQRELFHGDIGMLNFVLDTVNGLNSMAEVQGFLSEKFRWEPDGIGVPEFTSLLERYFNSKNN